jgi:hypothetical protein
MWRVRGTLANLETERLSGTMDMQQPQLGLHALRLESTDGPRESLPIALLRLQLPGGTPAEEIQDHWVRGTDLVCRYAATKQRAAQPEIYWRCLDSPDATGLELIISVQTSLLDDHPGIGVESELPESEVWWLPSTVPPESARLARSAGAANPPYRVDGAGTWIVRLASQVSYLEMIYPTDFCESELSTSKDRIVLQSRLFPERLEKGVIRRGRIRGWLVQSAADLVAAHRLFQEFASSEPPLTT